MRWIFVALLVTNALYAAAYLSGFLGQQVQAPEEAGAEYATSIQMVDGRADAGNAGTHEPVADGCPALGPVVDRKLAEEIASELRSAGYQVELRAAGDHQQALYWVYVPTADSVEQGLRRLREMHAAGIDSFLVSSGPDRNAISLGLFANRASALGVQSRLRTFGYEALIREQLRSQPGTWLVLGRGAQGYMEVVRGKIRDQEVARRECGAP